MQIHFSECLHYHSSIAQLTTKQFFWFWPITFDHLAIWQTRRRSSCYYYPRNSSLSWGNKQSKGTRLYKVCLCFALCIVELVWVIDIFSAKTKPFKEILDGRDGRGEGGKVIACDFSLCVLLRKKFLEVNSMFGDKRTFCVFVYCWYPLLTGWIKKKTLQRSNNPTLPPPPPPPLTPHPTSDIFSCVLHFIHCIICSPPPPFCYSKPCLVCLHFFLLFIYLFFFFFFFARFVLLSFCVLWYLCHLFHFFLLFIRLHFPMISLPGVIRHGN